MGGQLSIFGFGSGRVYVRWPPWLLLCFEVSRVADLCWWRGWVLQRMIEKNSHGGGEGVVVLP